MTSETTGALNGIRVIDLSRVLAGPWSTQLLADFGADVIKIERPGRGDDTRHWGPPWLHDRDGAPTQESAYFLSANRNKRSVAVDFSQPQGAEIVTDLVRGADVVVENFKVGTLQRHGLDYESLRVINPGLIYVSITGFGQTGPRASEPGYDYLAQSLGGLMSITGRSDDEPGAGPVRSGVAVADLATGMYATVAILTALIARQHSGAGQYIDVALLDSQIAFLANQAMNFLISGQSPIRTGSWHVNLAPYQVFDAQDGPFIIAVGNDDQFAALATVLGAPGWSTDDRFCSMSARNMHRQQLADSINQVVGTMPIGHWLQALRSAGVPCSTVNTIAEVFDEPQVMARGIRHDVPHSAAGTAPTVANPIKMSRTPAQYRHGAPLLGEHTDEVLRSSLGFDDARLAALRELHVIA